MLFSPSLVSIAPALVAAQKEMENADKVASNPHFKSKYADLPEVLDTVKPVLNRHGIALVQSVGAYLDGVMHVSTYLFHSSGEWIGDTASVPLSKQDAQGAGSAVTYLRRYSAAAIAAIGQEDDDGNAASARTKTKATGAPVGGGGPPAVAAPTKPEVIDLWKQARINAPDAAALEALKGKMTKLPLETQLALSPLYEERRKGF